MNLYNDNGFSTVEHESVFTLHALDFEPEQECDSMHNCSRTVTWRVTCRLCRGWGLLCDVHTREAVEKQQWADACRGGQRCNLCEGECLEMLVITPLIAPGEGRLW